MFLINAGYSTGEMMMSIFWYYRPEHTKQGIQESYAEDEIFASKHKDHNSVATVEDKCYVLTYAEYCRWDIFFIYLTKFYQELFWNLDTENN